MINYKKFLLFSTLTACSVGVMAQKFTASYTPAASADNFSGKVILYLSKDFKSPKDEMVGVELFPCYSIDVKNLKPGEKVTFDDAATFYPVPLSDIERGVYHAQVVWDRNAGARAIGNSPGNVYNPSVPVTVTKNTSQVFDIVCNS